ncbi:MAG: glucuronate isomerase [Bacteroidales bacterium]
MKDFMGEDFLLQNKTAETLYHEFAKKMPVIDYHCHLNPKEIAENHKFENITQAWLYGDHYKWRAMRTNGVNEKYCTGNATDWEKFEKWAETVPDTLRNPLYHWTHLELRRYFGIESILNQVSAKSIFEKTSSMLQDSNFRVQGLLSKMNVEIVCTTDDPVDSLEYHQSILNSGIELKVFPTWRADKAMAVENPETYNQYIIQLAEVSNHQINKYTDLLEALKIRHNFFHKNGCRLSDHGLENFYSEPYTQSEIDSIFTRLLNNKSLNEDEVLKFKSAIVYELAVMDHEKKWTQQFHVGAIRNNNSRMYRKLGPDKGFDSIGDFQLALSMARFLDRLETDDKLAKTILYNLNPSDNEVLATMTGNFQDGSIPGKIQFGSGWWFLDQKDGMIRQMNALSNMGLLSRFVGMLTDSRSFLSYPRHEYFRRILCNLLGNDVENGEIPNDKELLGKMVENICYYNAKEFFNFQ